MALKNVLVEALKPHEKTLQEWKPHQLEALFLGFGDISIFNTETQDYLPDEDLGGRYNENAEAIFDALLELNITNPCEVDEMYWLIESCAGYIREDLKNAIENVGYKCFLYFNPSSENKENHKLREVNILTANFDPSI
tara:strand:- start:3484 stop:3897 length:414 start_codon:yes stop_codon:yes gene_type:complete